MRMRAMAVVAATCMFATAAFLAGCGPKDSTATQGPTSGGPVAPAPTPTPSPTQAVKDLTPGNCTMFTKADATKLIGGGSPNKNLEIGTNGGQKIDVCSYLNIKSLQDIVGTSYAVVRYSDAATAFTNAKAVQTEMLSDANEHAWSVDSISATVPGAGQVLGGYGTKVDQGITFTIAVVGTNVGPYLVVALGASTESVGGAKNYALSVFQQLAAAVG
jgi:hypothetical protein